MHHDTARGLRTLVGYCHICHNRQGGELRQIIMTLDAIAEQADQEQDAIRDGQAKHDRCQKNEGTLGADLTLKLRRLDNLTLISRSS